MGKSERDQKLTEIKRNEIINGMEKALQSKSYDRLTINDVAKEAEYSKKTVYSYFKSKDEIYLELLIRKFNLLYDKLQSAVTGSGKRGIEKILVIGQAYYSFSKDFPEYMQDIIGYEAKRSIGNSETYGIVERLDEEAGKSFLLLDEAIREGFEDKTVKNGTDAATASISLWASINGFILLTYKKEEYIKSNYGKSMDELFNDCMKLIISSLKQKDLS